MTPEEKRDALIELIDGCIPDDIPGYRQRYTDQAAAAILARFNVTERDEDDWEYGVTGVPWGTQLHRSKGYALEAIYGSKQSLVRRRPASEWEATPDD